MMMNVKMFLQYVVAAGLFATFQGCNKGDEIRNEGSLHFDQSELSFDASGGSAVVQILDAKDWVKPEGCGVANVTIETGDELSCITNDFLIESNGKGDTYNVYINPFASEVFSIERRGGEIHIQVNENTGPARKLTIAINAAYNGQGEIKVFQGKQ